MAVLSLLGLGVTLLTIYSYDFKEVQSSRIIEVEDIGKGLLEIGEGGYILPFELISVLLLAAMIGAIIIAKGQKKEVKK